MRYRTTVVFLAPTLLVLASLTASADDGAGAPTGAPAGESSSGPRPTHDPARMKIGDDAFLERKDERKAQLALEIYREQFKKAPDDPETGWRLAMASYFVGLRLVKDADQKEALFAEGRDAGKKSVAAAERAKSACAACHFWTAINMALYGDSVGPFKMLFSLADIEDHLKKSVEADPGYAFAGAYRLLGLIEQKLPGILGGNNDEARDWFAKAIEKAPGEPLNYLFMAQLLSEEFDNNEDAARIAEKGLHVPAPAPDRLEAIEAQTEIRDFLKKIKPDRKI